LGSVDCFDSKDETIYEYSFETIDGKKNVSLNEYKDQTLLIVNVATFWGLTPSHLTAYNALKKQFSGKKFEIIAFPNNLFEKQEPGGTGDEILNGIKYVRPGGGYVPNFVYTKKIEVNGANEHPLWGYLKRSCPETGRDFAKRENLFYDPLNERDIRWNFEGFLIHPSTGKPIKRYDSSYDINKAADDIKKIVS